MPAVSGKKIRITYPRKFILKSSYLLSTDHLFYLWGILSWDHIIFLRQIAFLSDKIYYPTTVRELLAHIAPHTSYTLRYTLTLHPRIFISNAWRSWRRCIHCNASCHHFPFLSMCQGFAQDKTRHNMCNSTVLFSFQLSCFTSQLQWWRNSV